MRWWSVRSAGRTLHHRMPLTQWSGGRELHQAPLALGEYPGRLQSLLEGANPQVEDYLQSPHLLLLHQTGACAGLCVPNDNGYHRADLAYHQGARLVVQRAAVMSRPLAVSDYLAVSWRHLGVSLSLDYCARLPVA